MNHTPATGDLRWHQSRRRAPLRTVVFLALLALPTLTGVFPAALADDGAAKGKQPESWAFSEAMERRAPLQRVAGTGSPALCRDAPETDARFDAAVDYAVGTDSYSLLIWQGGECRFKRYFAPHDASLRSESASMHKSVVALLLAAAMADGYIDSADDHTGRYLKEWAQDPRGDIPLRHVLTMASGLEPFSREGGTASLGWRYIMGDVNAREATLDRPLAREPGTLFHYSQFNTQLLLMVIEAATGRPYAEYLSERLWQPLGAGDAYLWMYEEEPAMPRAYMSLMATADDWLRVGLLLKNRGVFDGERLLPAALIDQMTAPSGNNPNYGWQIWLGNEYEPVRYYNRQQTGAAMRSAEPFAVDDMIYLDGIGGQRVYVSRSSDLVVVHLGDMRLDWDDSRLPNLVLRALNSDASEAAR